jgi:8-oxoguanine deaminase
VERIIIRNADILLTMNHEEPSVEDAFVILENGKIATVGSGVPPALPNATDIDASGCAVMPGLINTHHHFYQTLTRAYPGAVNSRLFDWLTALYPVWAGITAESIRLGTQVAVAELLLSGTTTSADHHYVFPQDAEPNLIDIQIDAAREMGIRFVATRGSMSLGKSLGGLPPDNVVQDESTILSDTERLIRAYHDDDPFALVQVAIGPCSPFSVSPRLMEQSANLANEYAVRLHTHLAETTDEIDYCRKRYGCTPVELLKKTGWLCESCWIVHGIHFSDREIAMLGDARVGIAHCPTSNMRLGSGIAPVLALRDAGCPVGLAVDGSASNDSSHMMLEVRQALLLGRLGAGPLAFTPQIVLELATAGGAECLGRGDALGRIIPGYAADIAVFDLEDLAHSGAVDPVAGLVLCAPPKVRHLFVAGRHIVENGVLRGVDIGRLRTKHREESARLVARLSRPQSRNTGSMEGSAQ